MKLTREQAVAEHRKMWRWIADETRSKKRKAEKYEYFKKFAIVERKIPYNKCYCCEYAIQFSIFNECRKCPIDWGSSANAVMCCDIKRFGDRKGLYPTWCNERDWQKAADLAERIANLPERRVE